MEAEANRTETPADLLQNPFMAFVGAVVLVFLVLAALYESWTLPLSVILVVPMCLLCALAGVYAASMELTSSCRWALSCWSAWRARTPS